MKLELESSLEVRHSSWSAPPPKKGKGTVRFEGRLWNEFSRFCSQFCICICRVICIVTFVGPNMLQTDRFFYMHPLCQKRSLTSPRFAFVSNSPFSMQITRKLSERMIKACWRIILITLQASDGHNFRPNAGAPALNSLASNPAPSGRLYNNSVPTLTLRGAPICRQSP